MNSFDAVVYLGLLIAVVTGFNTGLLRSAITILAYLFAMPIAVAATSLLAPQISGKLVGRVSPQTLVTWGVAAIVIGGTTLLVVVLSGIGLVGVLPSLFVIVASLGLVAPNATALALEGTRTAGSASALLGVVQFTIGAVAAPLVGMGGTMTAVPMAAVIATFGMATLITFIVLCHPAQPDA